MRADIRICGDILGKPFAMYTLHAPGNSAAVLSLDGRKRRSGTQSFSFGLANKTFASREIDLHSDMCISERFSKLWQGRFQAWCTVKKHWIKIPKRLPGIEAVGVRYVDQMRFFKCTAVTFGQIRYRPGSLPTYKHQRWNRAF